MKFAYLIMAHHEWSILQRLVYALDDERNEIFIHFDKKVRNVPNVFSHHSTIHILKNRVDVRWGDVSQIKCEYKLWEEAYAAGPFSSYILISGVHYPLKSNDYLSAYWEHNQGQNLVFQLGKESSRQEFIKVRRYNFFTRTYAYGPMPVQRISQILCTVLNTLQKKCKIERNRGIEFLRGANWTVLSQKGVAYMLSEKKRVLKIFKYSFCGDEYFVPTMISMSDELRNTLRRTDELIHQEIIRANARVFTEKDLPELLVSNCLFVRKVNAENISLTEKLQK